MVAVRVSSRTCFPMTDGSLCSDRGPEAVGKHRCARGVRTIVAHVEQPPKHRTKAHDLEIGTAYNAGPNFTRVAQPEHREPDRGKVAKLADRFYPAPQILDFRHRKIGRFPLRCRERSVECKSVDLRRDLPAVAAERRAPA